ncbi:MULTISPECIES: carboxymuconolactone decarboxylase family protein [Streptomyces]|uniref:Carboxymuconolactone decarboxylase family protein n=1 Tax=Streptomyces aquilus TaxID=2548456 RepID=A0A3S9I216_9ACTN|nr:MULTISPECIES: carboxymuconolactone decarboxylase family protein [Streptomyces]AZP18332.1 carboxymuconolactone decarboxylase family protein [Streptomyces aquilus]MBE8474044.1 carboxymuconolactone decarboxylase family protein [Streptomyces justiciae]
MEARLSPHGTPLLGKVLPHLIAANKAVAESGVPAATQELVKIRASQINGCGACLDMHTKEAAAAGETQHRLLMVAAWREAKAFTEPERAALELTEAGTRLADGSGVPDDVWQNAAKHYDEEQLLALVMLIGVINFFNRMNVMTRQPAGDYQVGMLH